MVKKDLHMNVFRLGGDLTHLLSFIILLIKIRKTRSCRGISLKTIQMCALAFLTRYSDLFFNFLSLYNTIMKIVFIAITCTIIYWMMYHRVVKQTYDKDLDTFRVIFLIAPSIILALIFHKKFTVFEILFTFSLWLESISILPQLVLLQRTQNIDNITSNFVFLLGAYRGLYVLNWIFLFATKKKYWDPIVWFTGILQTALYVDFFYYYAKSWKNNVGLRLPP